MEFNKRITLSLSEEHYKKLSELAALQHSDKSKLFRKWIDENYNRERERDERAVEEDTDL